MEKQQTFASAAWNRKGKTTRRERFLAEMDAVIPWSALIGLIEPHDPNSGQGRPPHELERIAQEGRPETIVERRLVEAADERVERSLVGRRRHRRTLRSSCLASHPT